MRIFLLAVLLTVFLPGSVRAEEEKKHIQVGIEFLNNGDYDAAIESFKKALAEETKDPAQIYNLLGLTYLKQNKSIKSAIGSFEEALKINPQYAEVYFNLATVYAGPADDPALAAEYFNKTIEIDPHYSKAYFGLGWFTLTEKKDPVKSLEYFKKTLELYPDFPEAHYALGLAQIQMKEAPLALASISVLRGLHRNDLAVLLETTLRQTEPDAAAAALSGKPVEGESDAQPSHPVSGTTPVEISLKGKIVPLPSKTAGEKKK